MTDFLGKAFGLAFRAIYDWVSNLGSEPESVSYYAITIIIATILFRIIQVPLGLKQHNESKKMARVQPKIAEIQEKYKNDPMTMNAKLTKLMQEEKYNPLGGCLPLLIQFPIIAAFWKVLQNPQTYAFADGIYHTIQLNFLWVKDLKEVDPIILPLLSAIMTFLTSYLSMKSQVQTQVGEAAAQAQSMQKSMLIMMPVMIFFMGRGLAAGLSLYWTVSNTFYLVQQFVFNRMLKHEREEAMKGSSGVKILSKKDNIEE